MLSHVKKWVLPVHRWTGMTVGLIITVMAITGSMLMFRPQIEPTVSSNILSVPACSTRVSIDRLTQSALSAHPAGTIDFIRMTPQLVDGRTVNTWIRFTDKKTYYFNPCTGDLQGEMGRYRGPFGSIENIHRFRWMENGSFITGTSALLFAIIMLVGGVILWAPTNRRGLRQALTLNRKASGRSWLVILHRFTGVYAAVFLLLSALTGLPQAFPWYKDLVYLVGGSSPPGPAPKSAVPTSGAQRVTMQSALDTGNAFAGKVEEIQLRYPAEVDSAIEGFYVGKDAPHLNARSLFNIDAYSGALIDHTLYAKTTSGHKFYFWTLTWHHGLVLGIFTQILVLLGALSVPLLAYTGFRSWWMRRSARRKNRNERNRSAQTESEA